MRDFEILPHTADVRLHLRADGLEELFRAGLEGMNYIIKNDFSRNKSLMNFRDVIEVSSIDESMLLVDFLSEVLTLSHQYKAIYHQVEFQKFGEKNLLANLTGDNVDSFDEDIKAVTYTETQIKRNENNLYEAIVVFDI